MSRLAAWALLTVLQAWVHDRSRLFPFSSGGGAMGSSAPAVLTRIVRRVRSVAPVVVITFDACATRLQANGFDRPLYDLLLRERLPATVFVSGRWIETHPAEFGMLAANPLIEIGNHSYDHPHMSGLSEGAMSAEVMRTNELIAAYGRQAVGFRPPFGDVDAEVVQVVARAGLPTVMWDVVSGDPGKRATKESIERQVLTHARPGSIIIFHINGRAPHTAEALPEILAALRGRGFSFAPLSQFLRARAQ